MHVVVCVKQVPDTTQVRVDPITNTLVREGIPTVVNPFDFTALECALRVKDRYGASITLVTMGPPDATKTLKQCLAYGADRAVLLTDRAFAGSDTWATSYTLAAAIRRLDAESPVALVICGKQTIDGDTAQTGPGIARHLGWRQIPSTTAILGIAPAEGVIVAERKLEHSVERLRTLLPVVATTSEDAAEIRYASLPHLIAALRATPEIWSAQHLAVDPACLGLKGSPTRVKRIFAPPQRTGGPRVAVAEVGLEGAVDEAVQALHECGVI